MKKQYEIIQVKDGYNIADFAGAIHFQPFLNNQDPIHICRLLNRLAKLEEVCREIVDDAPANRDKLGAEVLNLSSCEIGHQRAKYLIAQKLKAVLEES